MTLRKSVYDLVDTDGSHLDYCMANGFYQKNIRQTVIIIQKNQTKTNM